MHNSKFDQNFADKKETMWWNYSKQKNAYHGVVIVKWKAKHL